MGATAIGPRSAQIGRGGGGHAPCCWPSTVRESQLSEVDRQLLAEVSDAELLGRYVKHREEGAFAVSAPEQIEYKAE
jgi:hypothetical protein